MLNDQNSSSSLILSAENAALHIQRRYFERDKITRYSSVATSLWTSTRETDGLCEKKKGKNKKQKKRRIKPRERNFVHRIYYLFIYLFAVNGNGRGERDAIAGSTMQRGREIGCCFCTPLFLSLKFHFIDVHAPLLSLPLEFLSRVVIRTIFGWYFSSSTFIYYSTSNSIAIFLFIIGIFFNISMKKPL